MSSAPGGAAGMMATAGFGFRYQYLSAGVNTGNGWATWNPNGDFVTNYVQESVQYGMTPVFTYYQLRQSAPNASQSDGDADYNNLQNTATMTAYFNDLKLFFQKTGAFPNTPVVLHMEPDLWAFLEQKSGNDDASQVTAQVAGTGLPELAGMPNTASGFAQAVIKLRDAYAPNVLVGYHVSTWGTGTDILLAKPDNATVTRLANQATSFYSSLHANFDLAFAEFLDRDSAFYQYQYGDNGSHWFQPADYDRNVLFLSTFASAIEKRLVLWQVPYGNTKMDAENNTWDHYQSNQVETLLGDQTNSYLSQYINAGVIAILFGRGADGATDASDADKDGVTNPAAINGNTGASLGADDDGGYFREQAARYYNLGPMTLP